jgi:hypothetical protein
MEFRGPPEYVVKLFLEIGVPYPSVFDVYAQLLSVRLRCCCCFKISRSCQRTLKTHLTACRLPRRRRETLSCVSTSCAALYAALYPRKLTVTLQAAVIGAWHLFLGQSGRATAADRRGYEAKRIQIVRASPLHSPCSLQLVNLTRPYLQENAIDRALEFLNTTQDRALSLVSVPPSGCLDCSTHAHELQTFKELLRAHSSGFGSSNMALLQTPVR